MLERLAIADLYWILSRGVSKSPAFCDLRFCRICLQGKTMASPSQAFCVLCLCWLGKYCYTHTSLLCIQTACSCTCFLSRCICRCRLPWPLSMSMTCQTLTALVKMLISTSFWLGAFVSAFRKGCRQYGWLQTPVCMADTLPLLTCFFTTLLFWSANAASLLVTNRFYSVRIVRTLGPG